MPEATSGLAAEATGKWLRYYAAVSRYLLPVTLSIGAGMSIAMRALTPEAVRALDRLKREAEEAQALLRESRPPS